MGWILGWKGEETEIVEEVCCEMIFTCTSNPVYQLTLNMLQSFFCFLIFLTYIPPKPPWNQVCPESFKHVNTVTASSTLTGFRTLPFNTCKVSKHFIFFWAALSRRTFDNNFFNLPLIFSAFFSYAFTNVQFKHWGRLWQHFPRQLIMRRAK